MGRMAFALRVMGGYLRRSDKDCPYCGNPRTDFIGVRRLIVQLRKCSACKLMFRWPKELHFLQPAFLSVNVPARRADDGSA